MPLLAPSLTLCRLCCPLSLPAAPSNSLAPHGDACSQSGSAVEASALLQTAETGRCARVVCWEFAFLWIESRVKKHKTREKSSKMEMSSACLGYTCCYVLSLNLIFLLMCSSQDILVIFPIEHICQFFIYMSTAYFLYTKHWPHSR